MILILKRSLTVTLFFKVTKTIKGAKMCQIMPINVFCHYFPLFGANYLDYSRKSLYVLSPWTFELPLSGTLGPVVKFETQQEFLGRRLFKPLPD